MVNNLPAIQEIQVRSLGRENPLEKGLATQYSSILIWRIPWTEKPGGLQSVGHDWVTNTHTHTHTHTHKHRSPRWGKGCKGFGMALRIPDSLTFCFSLLVSWYTHYVHNTHTHTHITARLHPVIVLFGFHMDPNLHVDQRWRVWVHSRKTTGSALTSSYMAEAHPPLWHWEEPGWSIPP